MNFDYSQKTRELQKRVSHFMNEFVYPNEARYQEELNAGERWQPIKFIEELKQKAQKKDLWNLFLPEANSVRVYRISNMRRCAK